MSFTPAHNEQKRVFLLSKFFISSTTLPHNCHPHSDKCFSILLSFSYLFLFRTDIALRFFDIIRSVIIYFIAIFQLVTFKTRISSVELPVKTSFHRHEDAVVPAAGENVARRKDEVRLRTSALKERLTANVSGELPQITRVEECYKNIPCTLFEE